MSVERKTASEKFKMASFKPEVGYTRAIKHYVIVGDDVD